MESALLSEEPIIVSSLCLVFASSKTNEKLAPQESSVGSSWVDRHYQTPRKKIFQNIGANVVCCVAWRKSSVLFCTTQMFCAFLHGANVLRFFLQDLASELASVRTTEPEIWPQRPRYFAAASHRYRLHHSEQWGWHVSGGWHFHGGCIMAVALSIGGGTSLGV